MKIIKCLLTFHKSTVDGLPVFAIGVRDGVYGNPTLFVNPPITEVDFNNLITVYSDKRGAYEQGGLAQKGPYQTARKKLMNALDITAEYVDSVAQGDEDTILIAGYRPSKGNRSETPAPVSPTEVTVKRGKDSGMLVAECANQDVAVSYGCIMTVKDPLPSNVKLNDGGQLVFATEETPTPATAEALNTAVITGIMDLNPGRKKTFTNLIPGQTYYFVFYAANASGVSGFSQSVSIMCV